MGGSWAKQPVLKKTGCNRSTTGLFDFWQTGQLATGLRNTNFEPLSSKDVCENVVHEHLEGGWSIATTKEHDGGFEESHWGDKGSFPLILFLEADVIVSPSYVKLGEYGGSFHVVNEFWDKG